MRGLNYNPDSSRPIPSFRFNLWSVFLSDKKLLLPSFCVSSFIIFIFLQYTVLFLSNSVKTTHMSSPDTSVIASFNKTSSLLHRYLSKLIYIFGTISNCLNALVSNQRTLRSNLSAVLMIIFGLLTVRNVRHAQNCVRTVTGVVFSLENRNTSMTRNGPALGGKRDRHLLKMLRVQVTLIFLFTCPHAIQKVYSSLH